MITLVKKKFDVIIHILDPKMLGKSPKEVSLDVEVWDKVNGNYFFICDNNKSKGTQFDDKIHEWTINLVNKLIVKPATVASIPRSFMQHTSVNIY
jgi:hypothetical protein